MHEDRLIVGAGQADISPTTDIQLAGYGNTWRGSQGVKDPLAAKAIVFEKGGRRFCFVSTDVCGVMTEFTAPLRRQIATLIGTDPEAVMIHGSQTHNGPFVGNYLLAGHSPYVPEELWWLRGSDPRYTETFNQGVISAVTQAKAAMRPATIKATRGMDGRISWNRRFIFRDGSAGVHPGYCWKNNLRPQGWADPDVSLVAFMDESDKPIAAIVHHTSHPSHESGHAMTSSDWPGVWSAQVSELLGNGCITLCANGACGDICTYNHIDPEVKSTLDHTVDMLMQTTRRIMKDFAPIRSDAFGWATRTVKIAKRRFGQYEGDMAWVRLNANPKPTFTKPGEVNGDWFKDVRIRDYVENIQTEPIYSCEIQVLRIGDFMLVGWPGEPFVELQFNVKMCSPAPFILCAHMCNDTTGYIPTAEAFERSHGGFDTDLHSCCFLVPSALEQMEAETKKAMLELY